jgi:hypothetical protein
MTMTPPRIQVTVPARPIDVEGYAMRARHAGLGRAPGGGECRIFIGLAPADAPDRAALFHVSVGDARFLRDALGAVLDALAAAQTHSAHDSQSDRP